MTFRTVTIIDMYGNNLVCQIQFKSQHALKFIIGANLVKILAITIESTPPDKEITT